MIDRLDYYITDSTDPYKNIALEEQLMFACQPGQCILYLWQNAQTVVIGRNQNAWTECKVSTLAEEGGHLARRLSGGGAVYHDLGNLNFTFLVRHADYDISRQLSVIEGAVQALGLPAQKTGRNDVTIDGRKFSGNAFYRQGDFCYHHGTLLVDTNSDDMARYLQVSKAKLAAKGVASVRARVVNLRELLPDLTLEELQKRLLESFGAVYGGTPMPYPEENLDHAALLTRAAELSDPLWLLGSNTTFSDRAETRFEWGGVTLEYTVKSGRLEQLALYSDGMDGEFLRAFPDILAGCLWDKEALRQQISAIPCSHPLHHQMQADILSLLWAQIE